MLWKDFETSSFDANSNNPNLNNSNCYHILTFTNNDLQNVCNKTISKSTVWVIDCLLVSMH